MKASKPWKARPVITSFKEYLNRLELSPASTVYPAITVAGTGVPLLARCGHGSIDVDFLLDFQVYSIPTGRSAPIYNN